MPKEIEHRFLVTELNPNFNLPAQHQRLEILQGYFNTINARESLRIRIIRNHRTAEITAKKGKGLIRDEDPYQIDFDLGTRMFSSLMLDRVEKTRHIHQGWEIDFFHGPLQGIVLAEYETKKAEEKILLPPWIGTGICVTDSLTNLHLARAASILQHTETPALAYLLSRVKNPIPKIVITGGPGSGKSSIMEILKKEMSGVIQFVPEVATILIQHAGIVPEGNSSSRIRFQKTLYSIQNIFEFTSLEAAVDDWKRALVLDRGTMDQPAYLPGGVTEFTRLVGTNMSVEYEKYSLVLFLDMPPREIYEKIRRNNPARTETYEQACAVSEKTFYSWCAHPRFITIPNGSNWDEKVDRTRKTILRELATK